MVTQKSDKFEKDIEHMMRREDLHGDAGDGSGGQVVVLEAEVEELVGQGGPGGHGVEQRGHEGRDDLTIEDESYDWHTDAASSNDEITL